ncbi:uncharacterized protein LOC144829009 [Lissotriton helveticus]
MKNPATVVPVLPRLDKKYKAPDDGPGHPSRALTGHPRPDSVISQAAQRKSRPWGSFNTESLLLRDPEVEVVTTEDPFNNNAIPPRAQVPSNTVSLINSGKASLPTTPGLTIRENRLAEDEIRPSANSGLLALPTGPSFKKSSVGGRVTKYLQNWSRITSDRWVLNIIRKGHTLEFTQVPPPKPLAAIPSKHQRLLRLEVQQMLRKGAIEPVPSNQRGQGFYSRFFLVRKTLEKWRPIFDLSKLNPYLISLSFRMVSPQDIFKLISPGDFMATLDLEDAYFHVPIHPAHRRFLRFTVAKSHFQFRVLPFGLLSAPRIFT